MATEGHHLSSFNAKDLDGVSAFHVGIVVSEWNSDITHALAQGAHDVFTQAGITSVERISVPGSFELPLAAQQLFIKHPELDGVLVIGNVIQGETKHFDFVCQGLTQGVMDVMLKFNKPVSFCVLTDLIKQQSLDRSGGKHGNKGVECAVALLQMIKLQK
jgi:6,7-dimethyl-8-ribityllumazine synthase